MFVYVLLLIPIILFIIYYLVTCTTKEIIFNFKKIKNDLFIVGNDIEEFYIPKNQYLNIKLEEKYLIDYYGIHNIQLNLGKVITNVKIK